jgi:PEP-CTERM motif-containing protein
MITKITRVAINTVLLFTLMTVPSAAETITFFSGDGGDLVNGGAAVNIAPHPLWGDVSTYVGLAPGTAEWISFENTGFNAIVAGNADSREMGDETALFTRTFNLLSDSFFSLWVLADDTGIVRLLGPNGYNNTLMTAFPGQLDPCAPGGSGEGLGCVQADMGYSHIENLTAGLYTLELYAFQTNGVVFGAQYAGQIRTVPEPGSLVLLCMGAATVIARRGFRRRTNRA